MSRKIELSLMPVGGLSIVGGIVEMFFYWPTHDAEWLLLIACWVYGVAFFAVILTNPASKSTYVADLCLSVAALCLYTLVYGRF